MDPEAVALLTEIKAELIAQNAILTANAERDALWQNQSLFLLEACALVGGILWGCCVWRLVEIAKRWRNPFW